jgi:hypothetical protein
MAKAAWWNAAIKNLPTDNMHLGGILLKVKHIFLVHRLSDSVTAFNILRAGLAQARVINDVPPRLVTKDQAGSNPGEKQHVYFAIS